MSSVPVGRKLDSDTLHVPELRAFRGHMVEIVVLESKTDSEGPICTSGCFFELSLAKPLDEATKLDLAALLTPEQLAALEEIADQGGPDVGLLRKLRAASMT